jgi:glycerophosphoryl diester phosphodiesterase
MNPPFEQATRAAIDNMHSAGLRTYPWSWNQSAKQEIAETVRLIEDGADGSMNNQVEAALQTRNRYL